FFDRIVSPVSDPELFILYAGDNDLGDGRHPEEVLIFFKEFIVKLRQRYPSIPFFYVSIKPSLSRNGIIKEIVHTNELIKNEVYRNPLINHYVDVYSKMLDKDGSPISSLFEED